VSEIAIRRLRPEDERSRFASGDPDLDRFFHRFAGQNQFRHHLGVTYVAAAADDLLGFVTLSASAIEIDALPLARAKRLPRYPLPVLRIARLAVASHARGQGVGQALLRFALGSARRMAEEIGCVGVVVDAKPGAEVFYRRYGFEPMDTVAGALHERPEPLAMFLPLSAIPMLGGGGPDR
jgi:GNAT superfamily N-acetyltransferase